MPVSPVNGCFGRRPGALTPVMPPVCEELLRKPGLEETNDGRRIGPAGAGIAAGAPLFAVLPADP